MIEDTRDNLPPAKLTGLPHVLHEAHQLIADLSYTHRLEAHKLREAPSCTECRRAAASLHDLKKPLSHWLDGGGR